MVWSVLAKYRNQCPCLRTKSTLMLAQEQVSVDDCVYFANGDIKNTLPDGSIEYYYSEVDTWHTTKPSGVEIFYFPDYQV